MHKYELSPLKQPQLFSQFILLPLSTNKSVLSDMRLEYALIILPLFLVSTEKYIKLRKQGALKMLSYCDFEALRN